MKKLFSAQDLQTFRERYGMEDVEPTEKDSNAAEASIDILMILQGLHESGESMLVIVSTLLMQMSIQTNTPMLQVTEEFEKEFAKVNVADFHCVTCCVLAACVNLQYAAGLLKSIGDERPEHLN